MLAHNNSTGTNDKKLTDTPQEWVIWLIILSNYY